MSSGFNRAFKSLCRQSTKTIPLKRAFDNRDGFDSPPFTASKIPKIMWYPAARGEASHNQKINIILDSTGNQDGGRAARTAENAKAVVSVRFDLRPMVSAEGRLTGHEANPTDIAVESRSRMSIVIAVRTEAGGARTVGTSHRSNSLLVFTGRPVRTPDGIDGCGKRSRLYVEPLFAVFVQFVAERSDADSQDFRRLGAVVVVFLERSQNHVFFRFFQCFRRSFLADLRLGR
jgi:hypothetical protein